jgi:molybdenum cofactor biosynthesis protein A
MKLIDKYNRIHTYLRFSITGNCNLSCMYCNPNNKVNKKYNSLSKDEILKMIELFFQLGINKLRLTGGEPLVRDDFDELILGIHELNKTYNAKLGITTNGILLDKKIQLLVDSGFDSINISLDSLDTKKFNEITGNDKLEKTINAIKSLSKYPSLFPKINTVVIKGQNDNEILDFVEFSIQNNMPLRFIEFMPFSKNDWQNDGFMSYKEIIEKVSSKYDLIRITDDESVAKYFQVAGTNAKIGFISSISEHFCGTCNRLRITNDGKMKLCLFSKGNDILDLKQIIDSDNPKSEICNFLGYKELAHPSIDELKLLKLNDMLEIGG